MKKVLIFLVVFYLAFVVFMPKENLYFTLKNTLASERIGLSEESLSSNLASLEALGLVVSYDGIESVQVKELLITPFLFYNKIEAYEVSSSSSFKKMFSFSADELLITYAIWNYNEAKIYAVGNFGELNGVFDLQKKSVRIVLEPSMEFENSPMLKQYFKKSEEGYIYETKIK